MTPKNFSSLIQELFSNTQFLFGTRPHIMLQRIFSDTKAFKRNFINIFPYKLYREYYSWCDIHAIPIFERDILCEVVPLAARLNFSVNYLQFSKLLCGLVQSDVSSLTICFLKNFVIPKVPKSFISASFVNINPEWSKVYNKGLPELYVNNQRLKWVKPTQIELL